MMNQYFGTWHGPKDSLGTALETIHDTWPDKIVIISEFGFFPHWERVEGPHLIDPERYYFVDDDADVDGQEADFQRQCLIKDQMATYRSKPYVAVATFWDYRGNMGVVDAAGRRRSSWYTLQEEFAPIIIELVDFSLLINGHLQVNITLRTRGPVEVDMPAYTLRGYSLTWALLAPSGKKLDVDGKELLPTLAPGTSYSLKIDIPESGEKNKLHLSIVRPTGFTVIEREVDLA
jgi:beta-glucuronidase